MRCTVVILALCLWCVGSLTGPLKAQDVSVRLSLLLQAQVQRRAASSPEMMAWYQRRGFAPAWFDDARPTDPARAVARRLAQAADDGLDPTDYHVPAIQALLDAGMDEAPWPLVEMAAVDVLLTEGLLSYARHLVGGRVPPQEVHPGWRLTPPEPDLVAVLEEARHAQDMTAVIERLRPPQPAYSRLRQALAAYRTLAAAGGWERLPDGPTLERGSRGVAVERLRRRLLASGDGDPDSSRADSIYVFDASLEAAVQAFQERHGLEVDGRVGRRTLAAMNVPAEERIRQLERALERERWLPRDPGSRYVHVNLAGCRLTAYEDGLPVLTMRLICGSRGNKTPVFTSALTELILAPYWNVPRSIAVGEILPQLRRSASYLARHHMTLYQGGRVVSPAAVDWSGVSARGFSYQIRQAPGPGNSLGPLKFILPNSFGIRLHGTNAPYLFERSTCAFSHGCLRMEDPVALAAYALRSDTTWTEDRLRAVVATWKETAVPLPASIPVYVWYQTAWVTEEGTVHFRDDVYGYDALLEEAGRRVARSEAPGISLQAPPAFPHR